MAKSMPPKGRPFKPGTSGNPGGRKPVSDEVKALLEDNTVDALKNLIALTKSPDEELALRATCAFLDRALGKAPQALELGGHGGGPLEIIVQTYSDKE